MHRQLISTLLALAIFSQGAAAATGGPDIDWSSVEPVEISLFYPGQASMEWILKGSDHSGKRAFNKGDRCFDCHEEEEADIGDLINATTNLVTTNAVPA